MIKCPVCGKEYDSISKVRECLEEHEEMELENECEACEALEKELRETYGKLQELINAYNEKYGFTFITNLCTFEDWLDENEEDDNDDECNCDACATENCNLEEFLKDKLNIEGEKKTNTKKLSMRDCFDLARKEGDDAVYRYFNTLSPDELKDLLDDGINTLCEDLKSLLSE